MGRIVIHGRGACRCSDAALFIAFRDVDKESVRFPRHGFRGSQQLFRRRVPAQFTNRVRSGDVPRVADQLRMIE